MVRISELVRRKDLKFCTGLRNRVLTEKSLSVFKIWHFAAIMDRKTCFFVQKCRPSHFRIWYVRPLVNYLKRRVTAFFRKLFLTINRQPTSGEVLKPEIGPGRKTETRPQKIKPLTNTGNLYGTTYGGKFWYMAFCSV